MVQTRGLKFDAEDSISRLPDDILLTILSKLDLKQQARTSILSTRWTNLWTLNTTSLSIDASDFNIPKPDDTLIWDPEESKINTLKFLNTAHQILRKHRGHTLDELKITCAIGASGTPGDCLRVKMNSWIGIAIKKQVKSLHLDVETSSRNLFVPLHSLGSAPFSSLVTLRLRHATLSSNIIHCLLSNSPNLLELSIMTNSSSFLHQLKISGSSLKLKHLELIDNSMDSLEICAPNLISFSFSNQKYVRITTVCFKSTPLLTQLSYHHRVSSDSLSDFYILFPQLESLTLRLSYDSYAIPHFPSLKNLKQLDVTLTTDKVGELCLFLELFKAAPSLSRLSLDMGAYSSPALKHKLTDDCTSDHKYLKEVEIDNFSRSEPEIQLLIYIANSASSLQKITIHPSIYKTETSLKTFVKKLPSMLVPQKELEILLEERNACEMF